MLRRYRFSNFQSFRRPTTVSFLLDEKAPDNRLSINGPLGRLCRVMAVLGANGSGKTNLLKPLSFLDWFVRESFKSDPGSDIPIVSHFFAESDESEFEVEFDSMGKVWLYQLTINKKRVLREALYEKGTRFKYLFVRKWLSQQNRYSILQRGFGFPKREAAKVRENASFISTAIQFDVKLVHELIERLTIESNVGPIGRRQMEVGRLISASERYENNPEMKLLMSELLHRWDLGLERVEIRKVKLATEQGTEREVLWPYGIHTAGGKSTELPFAFESSGTQTAFVLLSYLLPVLASGGVAVIDELENDLHPEMLVPILDLFLSEKTNPRDAQIIFTCHAVNVLNSLNKGQITLVEKDEACESHSWRLDDMKGVRADDNFMAKYLAGAYGAIPRV
jgi:predicted ATP-dependent endonuclease of OLD family